MKANLIILICVFTSFIATAQSDIVFSLTTNFKGVESVFCVDKALLAKTPKWGENDSCPPLDPKRARAIAVDYANQNWEVGDWTTDSISLTPIGKEWIYVVQLIPPVPSNGFNGMMTPVKIVVLMNGSVAPIKDKDFSPKQKIVVH